MLCCSIHDHPLTAKAAVGVVIVSVLLLGLVCICRRR
uniref:4 kDa protein n=1 Tax=Grapevine leafroll-associated virus 3 TaxID=55951 RepID=A0A0F6NU00_9CLOS|nr:4 kDa protein [Grapevine leafroll-associated virus 3]